MKFEKNVRFSGKKAKGYLNREVAELRWAVRLAQNFFFIFYKLDLNVLTS